MKTTQQAKGHGLQAWPYTGDFRGDAGEDGIIYKPSLTTAEVPSSPNDRDVAYRMLDFFGGPWERQLAEASLPTTSMDRITYSSWGRLRGDSSGGCGADGRGCSNNSSNPPWGWNDSDDVFPSAGILALDPARLVQSYLGGGDAYSTKYLRNRFVTDLQAAGFTSASRPVGFPGMFELDGAYGRMVTTCP